MANLGATFDSGQHEDMNSGFDPIPAGKYLAIVDQSEIKDTRKKDGKYISLRLKVIEGEYKGRFIWTNLNIVNKNSVAVEIAQKELATICRAIGKAVIQDTQELHGIPLVLSVKIKPGDDNYPAKNEPTGYAPVGESFPGEGSIEDSGGTDSGPDDDDIPF